MQFGQDGSLGQWARGWGRILQIVESSIAARVRLGR
jgi:hypothetical protein